MARRTWRRKGRRGLWLPVLGNNANNNADDYVLGLRGYTPMLGDGSIVTVADECTFDYKPNPWAVQTTTTDFSPDLHQITSGNEWRLRRIVGKCHAALTLTEDPADQSFVYPACEFAAGYIVLKTDEEGGPLTDLDEVNPLVMETADDPWIWRRKWILGNNYFNAVSTSPPSPDAQKYVWDVGKTWPRNTALYGSVADGPHIDQKTNRIIHRQERLFFMTATRMWAPIPLTYNVTADHVVYYNVDHRFFGGLSFSRGNRRNASR